MYYWLLFSTPIKSFTPKAKARAQEIFSERACAGVTASGAGQPTCALRSLAFGISFGFVLVCLCAHFSDPFSSRSHLMKSSHFPSSSNLCEQIAFFSLPSPAGREGLRVSCRSPLGSEFLTALGELRNSEMWIFFKHDET